MNSGMYAALSGNISAMRRLEVVSNNLANANTSGFKADRLQFESVLANAQNPTPETPVFASERFSTDFGQGTLMKTDNTLDLALEGSGFFVVNTPEGTAYTRQGNFHRASDGRILTAEGYEVLSKGGALKVNGARVEISGKGELTVDGLPAGALDVVDFPKPYALTKNGTGLYLPRGGAAPVASAAEVRQGYLEGSNVQVVAEMARLIEATRYFESCTRLVKSYDEITGKAANELGKV